MVLNSLCDFAFISFLLLKNFVILVSEVRVTMVVESQSSALSKFHVPNYYGFCGYIFVIDCATIIGKNTGLARIVFFEAHAWRAIPNVRERVFSVKATIAPL